MKSLSLSKDKIEVLLLEGIHPQAEAVFRAAGYHNLKAIKQAPTGEHLASLVATCHFLGIRSRTQLNATVLAASTRLTAIGCFCIGTNQVDVDTAQDLGIPVFNAPFANTRSVAELVLAEIIMLMRGVPQRSAAAHRGQWHKSTSGSHEIRGKTLGIVGYGHIGTQLGVLAESLGMQIRYYDIEDKLPLGNAQPVGSLQSLLSQSDAISLHVPATPSTVNLINAAALANVHPGACLINASRGNVVDIEALTKALRSHRLAGAAVDVFPSEPTANDKPFDSPLRGLDNVILTPHIGGSTEEAQQNIAKEVTSKLIRYSDNGSTVSAVNFPEVSMPDLSDRHRILHIHRNEPGMLEKINRVFSSENVNIAAQYLQTRRRIGYVVTDLEVDNPNELGERLKEVAGTIRTRILY